MNWLKKHDRGLKLACAFLIGCIAAGGVCAGYLYQRIHQENLDRQSMYFGEKLVFYGDSIVWQGVSYWYPFLMQEFGFERVENLGVSGRCISGEEGSVQDDELSAIYQDADVIVIGGGTNDWARSVELGKPESREYEEFNGALNLLLEKVQKNYPKAQVLLMTPPYCEYPDCLDFTEYDDGIHNNCGLSVRDYAAAMKERGEAYGIPVIDVTGQAGWGHENLTEFMKFDGAYLHPNEEGQIRIGKLIVNKLKETEPIRLKEVWQEKLDQVGNETQESQ